MAKVGENIYTVSSLQDSNVSGTFRYGIHQANLATVTKIVFSVKGVIKLRSSLPVIRKTLSIDGSTITDYNGVPLIEIDCHNYDGLEFEIGADGSEVYGMSVTNSKKNGILLKSNRNLIRGNFIGLDPNGKKKGNGNGIVLCNSAENQIGQNKENISGYASNVISGNRKNGIKLCNSYRNTIVSNFIGTNPSGTIPIPNGKNGIFFGKSSNNNIIGGTVYTNSQGITNNPTGSEGTVPIVYIFPPLGNLISGNHCNGVLITESSFNILNGNFIGTDVSGVKRLGNGRNGVLFRKATGNILRGCLRNDKPFVYYNVCSGNRENGIQITDSNDSIIQGNFFGIGASNATIVENELNGILVDGMSHNTLVGGEIPLGNVCAGNRLNGIKVSDRASKFITYNTFGGLYAFRGEAPNGMNGFLVDSLGKDIQARTNVFSGNKKNGIHLTGYSNNVVIEEVFCGTRTDGFLVLPNGENGLKISGYSNHNFIGNKVQSVIPRCVFSGNNGNGIYLTDYANNNAIILSFIGLSSTGTDLNVQNKMNGILLDKFASNNFIGTLIQNPKIISNFISANDGYGVKLTDQTKDNKIIANYIGLTFNGNSAKNRLGPISDTSKNRNIILDNKTSNSEDINYSFFFYENNDQSGVVSPVNTQTIMNIPYSTNWYGQRYLLSTQDNTGKHTPFELKNIKSLSFTVDLSNAQFGPSDNCNFNCYFVSSTSPSSPNSALPPINNTAYVPTPNYYDAAGADGGRFGVEFDVFEINTGSSTVPFNFIQQTGHFNVSLLNGTAKQMGAQCITYSSSTDFNPEPTAPANGAPDTNYRTLYGGGNELNVVVNFSNPNTTDETTISFNDVVVWNSKWLVGGTWQQWPTAPQDQPGYPCSQIGTLVPFANVTTEVATNNKELTLETINNANLAGMWLFIGMNPYFSPALGSYNSNHTGASGANGKGGNVSIKNFIYSTWS